MDDTALRAALKKLLAHGEAAQDAGLMKLAESKKPVAPVANCAKCEGVALVDGACPDCGYTAEAAGEADEDELAGLLEQG